MTETILAPNAEPKISPPYFFTASTIKLVVLSLCSFNFYGMYWFYKNFQAINRRAVKKISPGIRAMFCPIYAYSCFRKIDDAAEANDIESPYNIILLAVAFFVLQISANFPSPYWMLSLLSFLPLVPVNLMAQEVNNRLTPACLPNNTFTIWNWCWISGAVLLVLATVAGIYFLPPALNNLPNALSEMSP